MDVGASEALSGVPMTLPQKTENSAPDKTQDTVTAADDVLAQIGDIEQQFVAMRELVRKQSIMQLELQRRQAQIDEQTLAALAAQTALAQARSELSSRMESIEADRAALSALEADLERRSAALEADQSALEGTRSQLRETARELAAQQSQFDATNEATRLGIEQEREALTALRAQVEQTQAGFDAEREKLDSMKQTIAQQAQELALARDGFDADQERATARHAAEETRLAELSERTSGEQRAIEELESALEVRESKLAAELAAHEAQVATRQQELESAESELAAREAKCNADAGALEAQRAEIELAARSLQERQTQFEQQMQARRDQAAAELAAQETQVNERAASASKLEASLQAERAALTVQTRAFKERQEALVRREEELATAQEEMHGKLTALEERRSRLESVKRQNEAAAEELSQRQDALDALAARLEARAAELEGSGNPAATGTASMVMEVIEEYEELWRIERLHGVQLERERAELAARRAELEAARTTMELARDQQSQALELSRQDQAELERVVEGLKERLRETALRARELEAQSIRPHDAQERATEPSHPQAGDGHGAAMQARLARRRQRLKTYKDLVRRQSVKVRKAGEALTKRFEQVEQVLAMRADLAAARQRIIQAEKKELNRTAISRTVAPLAGILAIISLTGALSWAIAREIAPAKFAATAVLKAEGRDRALNGGELAEWQKLHEGLISDPRLHEALAERYKRQGMALLAAPGDVAELTKGPLTFETGGDGELKLRLEGQGAEQTARILEIFTNGMTNFVNSGSIRRVDGATTAIAQAAAAGNDPIDSVRTQYTLAMAGGGSLFCSVLALTLWRRLSQAKTTFERDTQLETLIDSVPDVKRD